MGFFGRLFARKQGGTRVGNALRQLAYDNTSILGFHLAGEDVGHMTTEQKMNTINSNLGG